MAYYFSFRVLATIFIMNKDCYNLKLKFYRQFLKFCFWALLSPICVLAMALLQAKPTLVAEAVICHQNLDFIYLHLELKIVI